MKISKFFYSTIILKFCFILDHLIIPLFSFSRVKNTIKTILSMKSFSNTKYVLLYLFLLSLLLRILIYFLIPSLYGLTSDSIGYYLSAVNGVNHGVFSTYWPPGFPILISIFLIMFKNYTIPILTIFLIVIGSLSGLLAYYISLKLFKNRLAALLAFLFICIQPSFLIHSPQLLSDIFAVMIMGISIYYMLKDYENHNRKISLLLGVIIGFLVLIRPDYIFMIIIYFLLVLISNNLLKIKVEKIALFIMALMLTLTPWLIYTDIIIGEPVISTNGGVNFYIGNNPNADGRYSEPYGLTNNNQGYNMGLNYISSNISSTLLLYLKKLALLISSPYILPWELPQHHFTISEVIYSYGMNIGFLITELIGLRGVLLIKQKRLKIFFISLIILINLTLIPFFVDGRLTLPLIFMYAVFGSYYIARVIELTLKSDMIKKIN
jgi:hypothetical protein